MRGVLLHSTHFIINFQLQIQLGKTTDLMSDVKLCAYDCCFTTTHKANCFKDVGTGGFFMMEFMFLTCKYFTCGMCGTDLHILKSQCREPVHKNVPFDLISF